MRYNISGLEYYVYNKDVKGSTTNIVDNNKNAKISYKYSDFGETEEAICIKYLAQFRTAGIRAEIYPEAAKMKKQMGYADAKKINYVALVGETEIEAGKITLKNMITGEQQLLSAEDIISFINK